MSVLAIMAPARCCFALLALPAALQAQNPKPDSLPLDSGAFVRGRLVSQQSFQGTLVGPLARHDSAAVCTAYGACAQQPGYVMRFPMADVLQLQVRTRTRAREGAIAGTIVGGALGYFVYLFARGLCEGSDCPSSPVPAIAGGGIFFAVLGAMVGSGFTEWRTVIPPGAPVR